MLLFACIIYRPRFRLKKLIPKEITVHLLLYSSLNVLPFVSAITKRSIISLFTIAKPIIFIFCCQKLHWPQFNFQFLSSMGSVTKRLKNKKKKTLRRAYIQYKTLLLLKKAYPLTQFCLREAFHEVGMYALLSILFQISIFSSRERFFQIIIRTCLINRTKSVSYIWHTGLFEANSYLLSRLSLFVNALSGSVRAIFSRF